MVTYQRHKTELLGDIITINKDGNPLGRLRQIGKTHSDLRLEWLTWNNDVRQDNAVQFPMCGFGDIDQQAIERIVDKYLSPIERRRI